MTDRPVHLITSTRKKAKAAAPVAAAALATAPRWHKIVAVALLFWNAANEAAKEEESQTGTLYRRKQIRLAATTSALELYRAAGIDLPGIPRPLEALLIRAACSLIYSTLAPAVSRAEAVKRRMLNPPPWPPL